MVWGHFVVVAAWWSSDFNFFEFFRRVAKVGGSVAEEWRIGGGGSANSPNFVPKLWWTPKKFRKILKSKNPEALG